MSEPQSKKKRTEYDGPKLELKCINSIRALSADQVQAAKSGHPGAPMGCAPMAHFLWNETMVYSPSNPSWMNRDRFVLSNGHACALQYSMLHLSGYDLSMEDLKQFRQIGSQTPGHPESFVTPGVEVCTGPLGQGISNAVGLAMAEKHLSATYNVGTEYKVFDNFTYVICGDGCLQEGVSSEACSLAGHLGLGKLIVLYDDNVITIDGSTDLSFTEDVVKRYDAYGWHTETVTDVANGLDDLRAAVTKAQSITDRPSLIKIRTEIGYGSPSKAGTSGAHGAPLGVDDLAATKQSYGLDPTKSFHIDDDVKEVYAKRTTEVESKRAAWEAMYAKYAKAHPEKAAEVERRFSHVLPEGIMDNFPSFQVGDKDKATRQFSESCLNSVAGSLPELIGGSADLTPSNLTKLSCSGDFQKDTPLGRYLRFGVREHAMSSICNGLFAYGGFRPFCATFLNFAGYALGAVRLSALSRFGVIYIMTHDSIGLGEDGPTHQPVEMLESLRSMPNLNVFRPADSNETVASYQLALLSHKTPSFICCSRSTVLVVPTSSVEKALKGAYCAVMEESPDLILIGTGSEVGFCMTAAAELAASGIKTRVVSMPCQEIFLQQTKEYQLSLLPGDVPTMSVEASSVQGWHRFSHVQISMTRFGMSGPGGALFSTFGFSPENIVAKGKTVVEYYKKAGSVPNLMSRPTFDDVMIAHGH